jgi:hypothetical protein
VVAGYDELDGASMALSMVMAARNSSNLDYSVMSPQWMATSALVVTGRCRASPWVSESTRTLVEMGSILSRLLDAADVRG